MQASDAKDCFARGLLLGNIGRFQEAAAEFSAAIELDPRHAPAYCNRAAALGQLGRLEEALADLAKAGRA